MISRVPFYSYLEWKRIKPASDNNLSDNDENKLGELVPLKELVVTLVGGLVEGLVLPEVGGQVRVRALDGRVGSLGEVAKGGGLSNGGGVAVLNARHLEELLGDGGGDDARSTRGGDQAHEDGTALAGNLNIFAERGKEMLALQGTVWGRPSLFPQ